MIGECHQTNEALVQRWKHKTWMNKVQAGGTLALPPTYGRWGPLRIVVRCDGTILHGEGDVTIHAFPFQAPKKKECHQTLQNQQEVNKYLTFLYPHYCHSELKKKKKNWNTSTLKSTITKFPILHSHNIPNQAKPILPRNATTLANYVLIWTNRNMVHFCSKKVNITIQSDPQNLFPKNLTNCHS